MSLLALSGFVLLSALATAGGRHIDSRDVCSSSPFQPSTCPHPPSSPWKFRGKCHTPKNTSESFCVYSSHAFADGQGVSILTTLDRAESIRQLPVFGKKGALSGVKTQSSPPYEERELPGRGRGLIANKTLHRGDVIFAQTPILIIDERVWGVLEREQHTELAQAAVDGLPPGSKKVFWELFNRNASDPVISRIYTNAFDCEIEQSGYFIVVPEVSRLNHDCRPNAAYFFDSQTLTHYVHAQTTITPGTEITIAYLNPRMPRQERRIRLSSIWGFDCSCSLCSMHPRLTQESDARLVQMAALLGRLNEWRTASPEIAQTLVSLYDQERIYASCSAYRYAALTSCAAGRRWDTIRYARLAVETGLISWGFRDEDVQAMVRLAEQPERELCWLQRMM
ncbi:SET domain-containing protein 5 [Tolypocladium capitatum]|uniref:SET domain-containing protein 5 n=1 Tax=Tolypocladium capitatum TaxID=45235 RepID=A0A2K3QGC4_9HYPO|nr:SET domain-containing protein 5 [Tolypocladium capitatum]